MKSSMNGNFVFALILIDASMALGDRSSDGVLAIGIGVAMILTLVGLIQMYREKEPTPLGLLQPLALGIGVAFAIVGLFEIFGRKKPKRSA